MTTKNQIRSQQQARSNSKANHALDKQLQSDLVNDAYNNKLKDIGPFRATILSIKDKLLVTETAGKRETQVVDGFNPANFYSVIVRPEWYDNSPAPWDFKDFTFDKNNVMIQGEKALQAIKNHPEAKSNTPMGNGTNGISLKVGDIVICTFGDGPNNNGKVRDLRFNLNKVGEDQGLVAAAGGQGAFTAFYKNQKSITTYTNPANNGLSDTPPGANDPNNVDVWKGKKFDEKGYNPNASDTSGFNYPGHRATYYTKANRKIGNVNYIILHSTAGNIAKPGENRADNTVKRFARAPTVGVSWKNKNTGQTEKHPLCETVIAVDGEIEHGMICRKRKKGIVMEKQVYTSIHYAVDQNGNIVQGVEEKDIANHAGRGKYNRESIGIEQCGKPKVNPGKGSKGLYSEMYNDTLLDAVAGLVVDICERWQIPMDRKHIIGHEEISSNRFDPGEKYNKKFNKNYWNWDDFFTRLEAKKAAKGP